MLGVAVIGLILVICLEVLSFGFLSVMWKREPRVFAFDIDEHVATLPEQRLRNYVRARELRHIYAPDPLIGWDRTPDSAHTFPDGTTITSDGMAARVGARSAGGALISTYGDSFTEGLEVEDWETWQEQLGVLLDTRVLNFGVSGYGPDQAVLLMERNLEQGIGRTPVVILAMINENFYRLLNAYRAFYTHPYTDVFLGFKPILVEHPTGFETKTFMPSDLRDPRAVAAAIREAGRYDYFAALRTERLQFPYTLHAISFLRRRGFQPTRVHRGTIEKARGRMEHVLDRFLSASERYGFVPVLVLLPERTAEFAERGGRPHPLLSSLLSAPKYRDRLRFVDLVALLSGPDRDAYFPHFDATRYIKTTHASAYGCAAIAAALHRALGELPQQPLQVAAEATPAERVPQAATSAE